MAIAEGAGFYDLYDKINLDKMIGMGATERIDMAPAELDRWKKAVAPIEANFIKNNIFHPSKCCLFFRSIK